MSFLPYLSYDGYYIENVAARGRNTLKTVQSNFHIDSISITETVHLADLNINVVLEDQSALVKGQVQNQKSEESLGFTTLITSENTKQFSIAFIEDFILNNQEWDLVQKENILAGSEGLIIPTIRIDNGDEAFALSGTSEKIDLLFEDFNLNNFIEIVGIDSLDIFGLMNGDLQIGMQDETPIIGDLLINDIRFNELKSEI